MAASRKSSSGGKKTAKKAASRRRSTPKRNQAGVQLNFLGHGLQLVLTWIGTALMAVVAGLRWLGVGALAALRGRRGRQPFGMILAAASLFVLAALLDYRRGTDNICGQLGYNLADSLVVFFGLGAFIMPVFGAFWGVARLLREESSGYAEFKLVGIVLLSFSMSLVGQAIGDPAPTNSFPNGHGGFIGAEVHAPLVEALGPFGLGVVLVLLVGLSSFMATEWAFVPLIREVLRRSAATMRQQDLPWGQKATSERKNLAKEAVEQRQKAATGLRKWWQTLRGQFRTYGHEAPAAAGEAGQESATPEPTPQLEVKLGAQARPKAAPAAAVEAMPEAAEAAPTARKPAPAVVDEPEVAAGEFELPGISVAPELRSAEIDPDEGLDAKPKRKQKKPRLDSLPPTSILVEGDGVDYGDQRDEINKLGQKLQGVFDAFGLDGRVIGAERGPTLTMYEVKLAAGVSVKKLKSQREDLGIALGTHGVRIVFPLPGRSTVGIEVPNLKRDAVRLKDVFENADLDYRKNRLPMVIGCDTLGKPAVEDLSKMPHMLIAGTTGSGKSVCLNSILVTMLLTRTPEQVRFVMIDPKQVELQVFSDIPHLLCPVVTDMKRAPFVLEWSVRQMEDRLHMFKMAGVRNINDYNALGAKGLKEAIGEEAYDPEEFPDTIPYFVVVIDELADLMMTSKKEVETSISRIAAKARAAGIHLIVATQRPSTDVVTGLIKANLPVRMSFRVNTGIDSRVVLDEGGADGLLGNGDFLYRPPGSGTLVRGQGAFVSTKEVTGVCDHLRAHGKPEFLEDLVQMKGAAGGNGSEVDDPLYEDAVRVILQSGRGSASLIQRALSVGYTRASRLIDIMTEQGVLGPFVGSKAREVLLSLEEWEEQLEQKA